MIICHTCVIDNTSIAEQSCFISTFTYLTFSVPSQADLINDSAIAAS